MNEYFIKNAYFSFLICQSADKKKTELEQKTLEMDLKKRKSPWIKKKKKVKICEH